MKVTRFLLSVLFLGAIAGSASAQSAYLNWDNCTGPINKAVAPGADVVLVASVLGQVETHNAYQVFVALGSGNAGDLRDAWRFDAAGCQGSSLISILHLPPAAISKACPALQGANASIQIKDYSYDALTGKARAVCANTYPAGQAANPTQRYFAAGFDFNHLFSVAGVGDPPNTCGGVDVPVCAHLIKASWLSLDGVEHQYPFASEYVTANDPNNSVGCPGATPAASTTWGQIKDQYKR